MESDISGRNKEMWITILLAVLLCLSIGYSIYQKRKTYRLIDRLLDSVLNREMIAASDVEEGEYSALVSKIKQIQEVLDNHVNSAEQEKEQVKSLVSNMSHQLNDHRLKAGGLFRAEAQTLRLKVALGAKAPSFPD